MNELYPLEKLSDKLPENIGRYVNFIRAKRFFTEEEIAANPNLFDPEYVKDSGKSYVSRETFKILNKQFNKRKQYGEGLDDFLTIIRKYSYETMTIKTIKYLVEKTGFPVAKLLEPDKLKDLENKLKPGNEKDKLKNLIMFMNIE